MSLILTEKEKLEKVSQVIKWITINYDPAMAGLLLYIPYKIKEIKLADQEFVAATDGTTIFYGQAYFNLDSFKDMAFVTIHEMLHIALRHSQRRGNKFPKLWNFANDAVINQSIASSGVLNILEGALTISSLIDELDLKNTTISEWNSEKIYNYILNKVKDNLEKQLDFNSKQKDGRNNSKSLEQEINDLIDEIHEKYPTLKNDIQELGISSSSNDDSNLEDSKWQKRVEMASNRMGNNPGNILRSLLQEYITEDIPWDKLLRKYMISSCLPQTQENWTKPGRHMVATRSRIFSPAIKRKEGLDKAYIIIDTSGSIDDKTLSLFGSEVDSFQKKTNTEISLIFADTEIAAQYTIKNDGKAFREKIKSGLIEAKGGGGTNLVVPILEVVKKKPYFCIVFTDGYTPFPTKQDLKGLNLIWVINTSVKAPVGKTIHIKEIV